jgi:hypothetical protein
MPGLEPGIRALPSLITTQTATLDAQVDPRIKFGDVCEDPGAPSRAAAPWQKNDCFTRQ